MDYINRHFEVYANREEIFSCSQNCYKLQEMSEKTFKCHYTNLPLKLSSNVYKTDLNEELNLFRKMVRQESSVLEILRIIFQNNSLEMYLNAITAN